MNEARPQLDFRDLVVGYGRQAVAGPMTGHLPGANLTALVGQNGSGKTTLLRTLIGLLPPVSGHLEGLGTHRLSYVPQLGAHEASFPVTAEEVVSTGIRRRVPRAVRRERVAKALAGVGLEDRGRRPFFELSGGQRQRTLVARALIGDAGIVAFDEPTTGVDAAGCGKLWQLMVRLAGEGRLVLVVSHDHENVERFADRVLELREGGMRERGA